MASLGPSPVQISMSIAQYQERLVKIGAVKMVFALLVYATACLPILVLIAP